MFCSVYLNRLQKTHSTRAQSDILSGYFWPFQMIVVSLNDCLSGRVLHRRHLPNGIKLDEKQTLVDVQRDMHVYIRGLHRQRVSVGAKKVTEHESRLESHESISNISRKQLQVSHCYQFHVLGTKEHFSCPIIPSNQSGQRKLSLSSWMHIKLTWHCETCL